MLVLFLYFLRAFIFLAFLFFDFFSLSLPNKEVFNSNGDASLAEATGAEETTNAATRIPSRYFFMAVMDFVIVNLIIDLNLVVIF